jgi:hypothetical protein
MPKRAIKRIPANSLFTVLEPSIKALEEQGKAHIAQASPPTVAYYTAKLKRDLKAWQPPIVDLPVEPLIETLEWTPWRQQNDANIAQLVESISQISLQHPISVAMVDGKLKVVAGRHRLLAFAQAKPGLPIPSVRVDELAADEREIWEIDENLRRSDLSPKARRGASDRRVELIERRLTGINSSALHTKNANGKTGTIKPLSNKERKRRHYAKKQGYTVPPSPQQIHGSAMRAAAQAEGVAFDTIRSRTERTSTERATDTAVTGFLTALLHHPEIWPEVKRRVEKRLGKSIVERIAELDGEIDPMGGTDA